ncbi:MAG: hypothetical protein JSU77_04430 [Fidelibacterota bacterium]|nr:MAG: hypothetical protein JSU77_04430 [Candidatus Neomarinimicrobiota bacterium]
MKKRSIVFILAASTLTALLLYPISIYAQAQWPDQFRSLSKGTEPPADFNHIPKRPGHYTASDWAGVIDSTWGQGRSTAEKLEIFDTFWNTIDDDFAGFQNLDIDWLALKNVYRPEVAAGVSRGRFAGIMSHLMLALREAHTVILDLDVYNDNLEPGVPLLVCHSAYYYADNGHFGAGLTPLPDSSLLVYKVVENHPLGLELGDIVLGYDGIPWKDLYRELLDAQLPVTSGCVPIPLYFFGGSSERSASHYWLMSAGLNWHLFDTLDVVKYGTDDTLHLATNALVGQDMHLICTEQLPVPGIPMPDVGNMFVPWVTWGIVEDTQIGYIYVSAWAGQLGDGGAFYNAVNTLIDDYQTTGLIIDFRINGGGQMGQANDGFSRLFNFDLHALEFAERSDPNDHFAMTVTSGFCSGENWRFQADPYLYDRPIAVLSGPAAMSSGDYNAMRIKFHPRVRYFGKPTNTAYTCHTQHNNLYLPFSEWYGQYAPHNVFLADDPDNYLMHVGFEVDEEVWLTQEDVAKGEDTVVKRAIEWIQIENQVRPHDVAVYPAYAAPGVDTVIITTQVANPYNHTISALARLVSTDSTLVDSTSLYDDGNHDDGAASDGLWGGQWPVPLEENIFRVGVETMDSTDGESYFLPDAARFTTIGPVECIAYSATSPSQPPGATNIYLTLRNSGATSTASDISMTITPLDTCVTTVAIDSVSYGNMAAGQEVETADFFQLFFNENCPGGTASDLALAISSGGYVFWRDTVTTYLEIAELADAMPHTYALHQNYPNPFNPVSTIRYELPQACEVSLIVYNILGREVARLVGGYMKPGYHQTQWDGRDASGRELPSGIYIARLLVPPTAGVTPEHSQSIKMLLLK